MSLKLQVIICLCVCFAAVCRQGCHQTHGSCTAPGECKCHYGWTGALCDQCVTFPGCVYGSCTEPWQCVCDVNWGGLLCDKVEHACLSSPCANGATCDLVSGSRCVCPTGFTGKYCQNGLGPCDSSPCLNGGRCVPTEGKTATCDCPQGYSGSSCEMALDPCNPNPCQQGAQCHSSEGRFMCACPDGYYGNECVSLRSPCVGQDCQGETHLSSSNAKQTSRRLALSDLCPLPRRRHVRHDPRRPQPLHDPGGNPGSGDHLWLRGRRHRLLPPALEEEKAAVSPAGGRHQQPEGVCQPDQKRGPPAWTLAASRRRRASPSPSPSPSSPSPRVTLLRGD
uniref:EGF-like domain-containing protein n=1 Tax=Poecilia reticulata TaxID=8081 RepID=A0A3P9MWS1_POERE